MKIGLARGRLWYKNLKDIQIRNPNESREDSKMESRSPFLLWLIWLVWLPLITPAFISLFQAHLPMPRLIATLVCVLLFFGVYLWQSWRRAQSLVATSSIPKQPGLSTLLTITFLTIVTLVAILLGGDAWQSLFYYTCGYVGGSLSVRWAVLTAIALALIASAIGWFTGFGWVNIIQTVVFISAIILITRVVIWSITTSWALQTAREEIARLAVTTERLRIARDLHDLLGHNLSLITLKSELAGRLISVAPEKAAAEIGDIENVARTTLQEVREAVASYRQPTLSSELHAAQQILEAAGITFNYIGGENLLDNLPTPIEATLSWIVREGVTNVIRHSHAQQCTVHLTRGLHEISVEVINDGVDISSTRGAGNAGTGIRGLAERVATLGGKCEAVSRDAGFRLAVSLPLDQQNHEPIKLNSNVAGHSQQISIEPPVSSKGNTERSE